MADSRNSELTRVCSKYLLICVIIVIESLSLVLASRNLIVFKLLFISYQRTCPLEVLLNRYA